MLERYALMKKLLSVILALTFLLTAFTALADQRATVTEAAAVYEKPNTASSLLGTLKAGASITVKAEKDGWAKIERSGKTGYMSAALLKAEPEDPVTKYVSADSVAVYKSAKKSSAQLGKLKRGAQVTVLAEKNGWAKIERNGKTGFCASSALSGKKPDEIVVMYVKDNTLAVYEKASASSKKLSTLDYAASVNTVKSKNGWTQIVSGTRTGYVKTKSLAAEKPYCKTAYVNIETMRLFKKASTSSDVIAKVGVNAELTVTAVSSDGKWARVIFNGKTAYCQKAALGTSKITFYTTLNEKSSGNSVTRLQKRLNALGYYSGTVNGKYLSTTSAAVRQFQKKAGLNETGVADNETQKALYDASAPAADPAKKPVESTAVPADGPSVASDWFTGDIHTILVKGTVAVLTDVKTRLSFRVYCTGGEKHPNFMPYAKEDTAVMMAACGNTLDWTRRPCWISIDGVRYAASYNSIPQGTETLNGNGYTGTFCVHFPGSHLDSADEVCELHQAAIREALKAG